VVVRDAGLRAAHGRPAHLVTSSDVRPAADPTAGFRPDLEGLRAVAVVLVLLYHASVPGFSGGYVGVDVFFVLSGFLITGLLLREVRRTGTISLPNFYARRARRLLPASALVLLVTIVATAFMMPPLRVPEVAGDAASAALYVSNMRFAFQATDYLQAELAPSPVLHFWSLSVEEQFYVFWPAIVLLLARRGGDVGRRIGIAAGAIAVVSFGLSLWLTGANQPWAFFSLPTRAWELGLGAFLAIGAAHLARIPVRPAAVMAWMGLAMVALSGIVLSTSTPFPGVAALLPTIGSALMIAGGFRQSALAPGRWLSTAVPSFLGRISYSLYLWHWPLLVLPAVALGTALPWWARGALVLLAVVLAAATQRWVEDPLRRGIRIGTLPRRNLAMAGALTLVVATVSLGIGARSANALQGTVASDPSGDENDLDKILTGLASPAPPAASPTAGTGSTPAPGASPAASPGPGPSGGTAVLPATPAGPVPEGLRPSLADARTDKPPPYDDGCHVTQEDTLSGPCTYGDPTSSTTVVLFGDSHALAWFPAVERLATERGWRLLNLTKSACSSVDMTLWNSILNRAYTECDQWRENSFRRIEKEHPALVLIANSRTFSAVGPDGTTILEGADRTAAWRQGTASTLERLVPAAGQVVEIGDTPRSDFDVPVCLSGHLDNALDCATPYDRSVSLGWRAEERAAAARGGVGFVDPTPWVCPSGPCPAVIGNFMVLRDEHHLATPFSAALYRRLGDAIGVVTASR
jgi:peptidoglycan/LPS O-acetylase OafA/YrhL